MSNPLVLDLPMPPSTNRLWRSVGRGNVIRSQAYRKWLKHCDQLCMANRWHKSAVAGPYEITITVDRSQAGANADLGNREKPVSDWLQHAGIIANDKLAERIVLEWGLVEAGCSVMLHSVQSERARLTKEQAA